MKKLCQVLSVALLCASFAAQSAVIKTVQAGATDQTVVVKIIDSADGTPETGVVFNTSGIDLEYWRHGANAVTDITEATQTVSGAHADGGFVHLGNGYYRLDLPDAAVASGATAVEVMGTVTGMIVLGGTVQISPPVNVAAFGGTTVTGRDIGASVLLSSGTGTGQVTLTSGRVNADVTHWGTTAVATARPLVDAVQISGDSGAADALETAFDGTAGAVSPLGIARQGTAQSATGTTLVLDTGAAFADDATIGMTLVACGSTQGYCQSRAVTDYVSSTDTATVDTWTVTPSGTITYFLFSTAPVSGGGSAPSAATIADAVWDEARSGHVTAGTFGEYVNGNVSHISGSAVSTSTAQLGVNIVNAAGTAWGSGAITAAAIATDAIGSAEIASGALDTSALASGAITAASIAADAFTAAKFAADVTTELQTGLATSSSITTLSSAVAVIDAIVDQLLIGVNVEQINGVTVLGSGTSASPWNGE